MRNPKPFVVSRDGVPLFVLHVYSAQQARDIIAARLSDTEGVTVTAAREGVRQ